jgi:hypothetical protein
VTQFPIREGRYRRALAAAAVLATIGFVMAESHRRGAIGWLSLPVDRSGGLGYEIGEISRSIREGRGFADPFKEPTGPTGWMPPAIPYLLACVRWLADDSLATVVTWARRFQWFTAFLCVLPALLWGARHERLGPAVIVCGVGLIGYFHPLFQHTHDHTVLIPLVTLTWLWMLAVQRSTLCRGRAMIYGAIGGALAWAGPALAFAWAAVTARWFWSKKPKLALITASSIVVVSPWIAHQYFALGTFVPIKSNMGYELWQSTVVDDNGVLDMQTLRIHPYINRTGTELEQVRELGEAEYVREKRRLAFQAIANDPLEFAERVAQRVWAAFVWYEPYRLREYNQPWKLRFRRMLVILPTLCAIYLFVWRRHKVEPAIQLAVAIMLLMLLPYLPVSYYDRYSLPTLPMQLLIVTASVVRHEEP